ncbi:atrial natriuretic peptide receptor 1 isoform 2-T10 [Glossina fuscipes fuscipes]
MSRYRLEKFIRKKLLNFIKLSQRIVLWPLLSLVLIKVVIAGCRYEPSRACEAICQPQNTTKVGLSNCYIRALILLPDNGTYLVSLEQTLAVLQVAEEYVHRTELLPNYIKFNWLPQDDKCEASYAVFKAMDAITKNCAHVIFGPVCDYPLASVARITKYFNSHGTPLISIGGSTYDFEQKKTDCGDEFYMLLRTGLLSFESISKLTISVMKSYNWSRSILFYDRNGQQQVSGLHTCFLMMTSLGKQMRNENMTFSQHAIYERVQNRSEEMKREIGNKNSVVIMCADPQSIRKIMLTAEELNMIDSGEYVFINIELFSRAPQLTSQPWYDKEDTRENNERARKAYTAMLTVTPKQPNDDEYIRVSNEIKSIAASRYNYTFHNNEPISAFVTSFYDGVLLYASALNDSIRDDPTILNRPINGTEMVRRMWNRSFKGITGNVTIDANGDRISAYSLLDMNPETGRFEIVAHFQQNVLEFVNKIHWAGNRTKAPDDSPVCGYDGTLCPESSLPGYAILSLILGVVVIIISVCFFVSYRHYKSEAEINSMAWKINIDEVICHNSAGRCLRGSLYCLVKHSSQMTLMSDDMNSLSGGDRQIFIPVGFYRGCKVAIKTINNNISLTRSLMLELKRMKDLQHDHLVKFYGACLDPTKSFILTEYCPKGSLQDILENEQFQLDWMFKLSLMHDIVRGMQFLHSSDIKSHGNLKSSNCVVDSRFVLKICDFGLHTMRTRRNEDQCSDVENCNSHAYWSKLLWTAPELLKMGDQRPPEGTQKGDVYSFAIIIHEITTRQGPFYLGKLTDEKSPEEIIHLIKGYPHLMQSPFRPQLVDISPDFKEINSVMQKCWSEEPNERPDFNALKTIIRNINKDNETGNIVDNLLKRMEQYANNLEELVEERTQDYLEEKKKCEKLLYQLLPQSVAAQLISGQPVVAEFFDQVTIYFSDIVGFTAISASSTPMQVVQFLNDLYTCFDSIVENFDVYKVETIGDAYMVVSGLPIRNDNKHAPEIARMALALLEAVHNFKIHHRPNDRLKLRIGLHTGACVAGVVGLKMPRYCLFGDTVNTASRMESNGEALKIHISEKTKLALDEFESFVTTRRGYVPMKGKGEMLTYWLEGEIAKTESPLLTDKLMISRRCSLKQNPRYGLTSKQYNEKIANFSYHNSPNLRVKRKISSSSPKLNDAEFKTEDFYYNFGTNPNGKIPTSHLRPLANDIHSSRSFREDSVRDTNWEMANFRLPLSGTLKTHANAKLQGYSQLSSTQSNFNLSNSQSISAKLKIKNSSTIASAMNNNNDSIGSMNNTNRIIPNGTKSSEDGQNLVPQETHEEREEEQIEEAISPLEQNYEKFKESKSVNNSTIPLDFPHETPLTLNMNVINASDDRHYENVNSLNNVKKFITIPNKKSNAQMPHNSRGEREEFASPEEDEITENFIHNNSNNDRSHHLNHLHSHHAHHHSNSTAVTQPLLAKINS